VKALDRHGSAFSLLYKEFPSLSTEKIKPSVFIGPQIRQLFRDSQFDLVLSDDETAAWSAFRHVTGFLGNVKAVNFRKFGEDLITSYDNLGCKVSIKMHFLRSHLDSFRLTVVPNIIGAFIY
jgi:hypothetical protein